MNNSSVAIKLIFGFFFFCYAYIDLSLTSHNGRNSSRVVKRISNEENLFRIFIKKYKRPYAIGTTQYNNRFRIFQQSLRRQKLLNAAAQQFSGQNTSADTALYGITQFSDLTPQEFQDVMLNPREVIIKPSLEKPASEQVQIAGTFLNSIATQPTSKDWRQHGAVTKVKNQRHCGACWAFSIVETVESMHAIKTKSPKELSVQQVINCDPRDKKCHGGEIFRTIKWLKETKTNITTEKEYPLTDTSGDCNIHPQSGVQVTMYDTNLNYVGNENLLVEKIANHGPVAVAVDAKLWQDYMGGIIQYHCNLNVNHAVQIVGYDIQNEVPYYIVRNSWGTGFGLDGYAKIEIGKNLCGIAEEVISFDTS